jgi:putative ubiquitin-RnfH superfamily antitoxin RatB of RatAB toxin-antitoxin module
MESPEVLDVRVIFALADQQHEVTVRVRSGTTVEEAVEASGLVDRYSEIGSAPKYAVFSRIVEANYVLAKGDRIEILRPLVVDPKDSRRKAAQSARRNLLRR